MVYSYIRKFHYDFAGKNEEIILYEDKTRTIITGENLYELSEKLFDYEVKWIALFDKDIHIKPQKGETIIHEIQSFSSHEKQEEQSKRKESE